MVALPGGSHPQALPRAKWYDALGLDRLVIPGYVIVVIAPRRKRKLFDYHTKKPYTHTFRCLVVILLRCIMYSQLCSFTVLSVLLILHIRL